MTRQPARDAVERMGKVTTLREAAEAALEALEKGAVVSGICILRAALAEPVQEPRTAWDDPRVQKVYDLLCDDAMPPNKQEHWEGWVARRIVDALAELTGKKGLQVEPVAYWHKRGQEDEQFIHAEAVNGDCPDCEPLYLAPQEHALEIRACECSAAKNGRCVMGDYGSLPIGTKLYAAEPCPCGDRPAAQCPGEWEPGCDIGNNPKHAKRVEMTPKELAASIKRGEKWKVAEPVQEPVARECSDPMCACRGGPCAECEEGEREKEIEDLRSSLYFYQRRCEALQSWQSKMRDPERTIVCDILANGKTLDPAFAGDRYTALRAALADGDNLSPTGSNHRSRSSWPGCGGSCM